MPAETPAPAAAGGKQPVVLEPIRLPAQVDQPQWLVRLPDGTVAVLEQDRWTSPLRDELRQALTERLVAKWGATTARPVAGAPMPVRVGLEVRRFDGVLGRESHLEGSWTVLTGDAGARGTIHCDWSIHEKAEAGMPGLDAAHRRAVERLGDAIGAAVGAVAGGRPAICAPIDPVG